MLRVVSQPSLEDLLAGVSPEARVRGPQGSPGPGERGGGETRGMSREGEPPWGGGGAPHLNSQRRKSQNQRQRQRQREENRRGVRG